jgi:hypothetical protein
MGMPLLDVKNRDVLNLVFDFVDNNDDLKNLRVLSPKMKEKVDGNLANRLHIDCPLLFAFKEKYRTIQAEKNKLKSKTWKESFIFHLRNENCLIKKICNLLTRYFPGIKKEVERQNERHNEIQNNINSLLMNGFIPNNSKSKNASKQQIEDELRQIDVAIMDIKKAYQPLIDLFGTTEEFNKIPLIKNAIAASSLRKDKIDFIRPEDMTSSVMRGIDFGGCPFLIFKKTITDPISNQSKIEAQTFFYSHPFYQNIGNKNRIWDTRGDRILPLYQTHCTNDQFSDITKKNNSRFYRGNKDSRGIKIVLS